MKDVRMGSVMLSAVPLAACTTAPAPNDTASRALNEMKAVAQPIPPKPDPRDTRIADLEQKNADFEAELTQVRSTAAGDLDQSKSRANELETQLSQRDRELAALRNTAGDKDQLAGQLAALQGQLSPKDQELAGLKNNAGDRDRFSSELAQTKQRITELERQLDAKDHDLAALKSAAGDREKLVADLAATK